MRKQKPKNGATYMSIGKVMSTGHDERKLIGHCWAIAKYIGLLKKLCKKKKKKPLDNFKGKEVFFNSLNFCCKRKGPLEVKF